MGQWTTYCILSGNPSHLLYDSNSNNYKWQEKVRVVLKDGSITDIGKCDIGGTFTLDSKKKSIFSFFSKKGEYRVADSAVLFLLNDSFDAQGFIISDLVYKYLKKNKNFNKCTKNKNLFELLKSFIPKNKLLSKYVGFQTVIIDNENSNYIKYKKYLWQLVNPDSKLKDGKQNKKRIQQIINNFVKFCCKNNSKNNNSKNNNSKNKKEIIKRYELKDDKSSKFWTIEYNKNGDFTTIYGKIGTDGRKSKMKKLSNEGIKKLIDSKVKKGYKLKNK
jgi:predicted DNA-binding WGR domain protein